MHYQGEMMVRFARSLGKQTAYILYASGNDKEKLAAIDFTGVTGEIAFDASNNPLKSRIIGCAAAAHPIGSWSTDANRING